jgi:glucosamine-6-phosphate deaminase
VQLKGCNYVAEYIIKTIKDFDPIPERPFVLGLPTGSSPEPVYAYLVEAYKEGRISFKNVVTFNMDEYVGLSPSNDQSYHYFMYKHFFNHVDIPKENINILDGLATNVEEECAAYEEKIKEIGGIHLFMGGIGPNGHIAFNEVGSTADSVTRQIILEESTIIANSRFFESIDDVPKSAVSVGIATVLSAKEVIVLAFGQAKAKAVKNSLCGEISSACPGSFMRLHDNVQFVMDKAASDEYTKYTNSSSIGL